MIFLEIFTFGKQFQWHYINIHINELILVAKNNN